MSIVGILGYCNRPADCGREYLFAVGSLVRVLRWRVTSRARNEELDG